MPKFTPIPNFDDLAPTTTKGDLIVKTTANGNVRLGVGADNTVLTASSGATAGVAWSSVSGLNNLSVATITGATTLPSSVDVALVSGTTFALTLPTSVGNSGKIVRIKKTDTGLSTPISVVGTGGQTFDGAAGITLSTAYEEYTVLADGANWQILSHITNTDRTPYTPTIGGFGTVSLISFFWERNGRDMIIQGSYTAGTISGSLASFSLPANTALSSSHISLQNTTAQAGPQFGVWVPNTANPQRNHALTALGSTNTIIYAGSNSTPLTPATGAVFASGVVTAIDVKVPISGWGP